MELGAVAVNRVGQQIGFRYTIGVEAGQHHPEVWTGVPAGRA